MVAIHYYGLVSGNTGIRQGGFNFSDEQGIICASGF